MENDIFYPLSVNLTGEIRHHYDEDDKLPAHKLVIQPLLIKCISAHVYGLKKEDDLYKLNSDILLNEKGKFKFDTSKECVVGHEYLWNATSWKRGSIIIVLQSTNLDLSDIFKHTFQPGIIQTPNSGNTPSATKKCREEMNKGNVAICLPASNGIEWMNIYAQGNTFESILKQAEKNCQMDYNSKNK